MPTAAIDTVTKMIESLPVVLQDRVVEHLQQYLEDLQDELHWDRQFGQSQPQLVAAARRARQQIAQGMAQPLDPGAL